MGSDLIGGGVCDFRILLLILSCLVLCASGVVPGEEIRSAPEVQAVR